MTWASKLKDNEECVEFEDTGLCLERQTKCNRCSKPISRKQDTDYRVTYEYKEEFLCKECFVKVVETYAPNADYFLPKHKFDSRFWTFTAITYHRDFVRKTRKQENQDYYKKNREQIRQQQKESYQKRKEGND